METLNIKIESRTEKLSLVRDVISDAARKSGFDEESVGTIALAVDEACTNIIKHAYEYAPNKEIDIRILVNKRRFEIIITHNGKMFDPASIHAPNMEEYLHHPRRGGLGMHLMRMLMDQVEYKILPDQTCEVHLRKNIPVTVR